MAYNPTGKLTSGDFTVEMGIGTGKTYVYLRTIFELHKNYGFTKFVIMVSPVAMHNRNEPITTTLPAWFKVLTPLGSYNPDWAVVVENSGEEKLYFVVETKGSIWWNDLRHLESAKTKCGKQHFEEIAKINENPARYIKSTNVDGMMAYVE